MEPQAAVGGHVGHPGQVVDDAGVGGAAGGHHREQPVELVVAEVELARGVAARAAPVSRPRSSTGASITSMSMTRAVDAIDEWASAEATIAPARPVGRARPPPGPSAAAWRAATSALEVAGRAARHEAPAGRRRAGRPGRRSSAGPGSRRGPRRPPPATTRRRSTTPRPRGRTGPTASVGADGTNDRARGWSWEMQAGASTSTQRRSASVPPSPAGGDRRPGVGRRARRAAAARRAGAGSWRTARGCRR